VKPVKRARKSWFLHVAVLMLIGLVGGIPAQQAWAQAKGPANFDFPDGSEGKVTFSHEAHLAKGEKCTDCHTKIFKMTKGQRSVLKMADMEKGQSCGVCHNGKVAYSVKDKANCTKCHKK
jgi:c(7)-type cytochrome triheme protein